MSNENKVFKAVGRVNSLSVLTLDAYGVAVKNGFKGTVEEWLASLKGEKGDPPTDEQVAAAVNDYLNRNKIATIGVVELLADEWVGSGNLYSQVVTVEGAAVTENSQVDLTPDVEQLAVFYEKDIAFVTENDDGVVTVYVIGQKPTNDYTIQVTVTEVSR